MRQRSGPRTQEASPLVDATLRVADIAAAGLLILLLLPMLALLAAMAPRGDMPVPSALRTFRGDQLPQLFGVLRGEYSIFRPGGSPRVFSD